MITSQTSKAGPYTADGTQRTFPFGFRVIEGSHLSVYRNDSPVPSGDYTVTLTAEGGNVTFNTAPASGDTIAIIRDVPATQEMDLQNNTAFLPEVLEDAFDKLTMMVQQIKEVFTRTLTVPPTEEIDTDTLFEKFQELAENAETWAEQARTGAATAVEKAGVSVEAANTAVDSMNSAVAAADSANSSAVAAAGDASDIRTLAEEATLNSVQMVYGDWGQDHSSYISYGEWTAASTIYGAGAQIAEHNASPDAHSDIRTAINTAEDSAIGTASSALSSHNSNASAHSSIRSAVSTAQSTADSAQSTANTAKSTADAALPSMVSVSGVSWCRQWANKWVEYRFTATTSGTSANTITLPIEMANASYFVGANCTHSARYAACFSKTKTSMAVWTGNGTFATSSVEFLIIGYRK